MRKTPLITDESPCNCLAIRQAARQVTQLYDRHLAAEGLRSTQYSILSKLGRLGPLPINALAATMAMDRTTLGRAIQPLQRDRLIVVGKDEQDGRARVIRLSAAGETRLKAAAHHWRNAQKEFEAAFGAGDSAKLRGSLARVVAAM
jgi:DNA-binding MarR family transcriptional regulator